MAAVRLESYHDRVDELPPVCMRCGAPTTWVRTREFYWHPPWLGLLVPFGLIPYLIVALALTQKRQVSVPLCEAHKYHWVSRYTASLGGLVILLAVYVLLVNLTTDRDLGGEYRGWLCPGGLTGLVAWAVMVVVFHFTSIRPSEITATSITLRGFSPEFVRVYEEVWAAYPDLPEDAVRERWQSRRPAPEGDDRFCPPEEATRLPPPEDEPGEEP
jgi:hypothetical protein